MMAIRISRSHDKISAPKLPYLCNKKREPLNGSLDFSGTEAFCADMEFSCFSSTYVNAYILDVHQPAASSVAIRVADCISCSRTATAAITELGHYTHLLSLGTLTRALYHSMSKKANSALRDGGRRS